MQDDIVTVIRSWEQAIQRGDLAAIVANHTKEVTMFDVPEPLQNRGLDAYRETWKLFYRYSKPASDVFVIEDLHVVGGDDVAFATGLLRIGGSQQPVCRLTLGLQKMAGQWLIAHEHHSAPHKLEDAP
jgi:ketosteroid isomerase-like protein